MFSTRNRPLLASDVVLWKIISRCQIELALWNFKAVLIIFLAACLGQKGDGTIIVLEGGGIVDVVFVVLVRVQKPPRSVSYTVTDQKASTGGSSVVMVFAVTKPTLICTSALSQGCTTPKPHMLVSPSDARQASVRSPRVDS